MIGYLLISVLYCATFIAFMNTRERGDERYFDGFNDWKIEMIFLCLLGALLWPFVIPFIIFYKIAFKILNKNKK
jgi:hypothetical protein